MKKVELFCFEELDSTNAYARREFAALPDGALVAAFRQSAGRGRLGRQWHSASGAGIYASLVMKECADPFLATMVVSLGALDLLRREVPDLKVWLKWPNDLYVEDRKLAGVLCETVLGAGNRLEGVIAGIGINVNLSDAALAQIDLPATSLAHEKKCVFCVEKLLSGLVEMLKWRYITLITDASGLAEAWRRANALVGVEVTLVTAQGEVSGRVAEIDAGGRLVLALPDGSRRPFSAADVRLSRESLRQMREK